MQETLNGVPTTFTMDLNTGLTQALSDGTNTYLYGNGRIAQTQGSVAEYFLGDALGSVRQLTNNSGAITYASAYDPYGVTTQTYGASQTGYGYTGEYTSNDMVFLRARMYSPGMGRFVTRDTWEGDANSPMSFNQWMYASGNPINRLDPTGMCWIMVNGLRVWIPDGASPCRKTRQLPGPALSIAEGVSQYISHTRPDGSRPTYYNLCGHFSVEMVIEALTGQYYSIHDLINAKDNYACVRINGKTVCGDIGTGADDLARLLTLLIGSQATVSTYSNSDYHVFELDSAGDTKLFNRNMHVLEHYWYLDEEGNNIGLEVMKDYLRQKNYLIVGMVLDTNTGKLANHIIEEGANPRYVGHWVVVKRINGDTVTVINPYRNRSEDYSWESVLKGSVAKAGWMVRIEPQ